MKTLCLNCWNHSPQKVDHNCEYCRGSGLVELRQLILVHDGIELTVGTINLSMGMRAALLVYAGFAAATLDNNTLFDSKLIWCNADNVFTGYYRAENGSYITIK